MRHARRRPTPCDRVPCPSWASSLGGGPKGEGPRGIVGSWDCGIVDAVDAAMRTWGRRTSLTLKRPRWATATAVWMDGWKAGWMDGRDGRSRCVLLYGGFYYYAYNNNTTTVDVDDDGDSRAMWR